MERFIFLFCFCEKRGALNMNNCAYEYASGGAKWDKLFLSLSLSLSQLQQRRDLCTLFFLLFCSFLFRMWEGGRGTCWLINFLFPFLPPSLRRKTRRVPLQTNAKGKNQLHILQWKRPSMSWKASNDLAFEQEQCYRHISNFFTGKQNVCFPLPSFVLQCCLSLAM